MVEHMTMTSVFAIRRRNDSSGKGIATTRLPWSKFADQAASDADTEGGGREGIQGSDEGWGLGRRCHVAWWFEFGVVIGSGGVVCWRSGDVDGGQVGWFSVDQYRTLDHSNVPGQRV